ncbi:DUF4465 domain-containing protein [Halosquirtibacter laminarini]|uniref:DUF4465 domain-containing protein n=1 Tax=Halosquirtibacter laminarini TaxID=3374600 RepID=A0AC61NQ69_9BACT|nr:DUF4465 domain-containing protein [Prolixibacteraceae bacterium]
MDLSVLGKVTKIDFEMVSTDNNDLGMINTPVYFCMDNVNGVDPKDQAPTLKQSIPSIQTENISFSEISHGKIINIHYI